MLEKEAHEKKMRYNFLHRPIKNVDDNPYFYFIYNNSNYYHFIYDSLPYLWSFFNLKKRIPNIKILTNTPFKEDKNFGFVNDCLYLLGVKKKDIVIANPHTIYNKLYVSFCFPNNAHAAAFLPNRSHTLTYGALKSSCLPFLAGIRVVVARNNACTDS